MRDRMPDRNPANKLRCPRCKSASVLSSPLGGRHCEDCGHDWGFRVSSSYTLDRHGNQTFLDSDTEARHKAQLARAAGVEPLTIGIDPVHLRAVLQAAAEEALRERDRLPWWQFRLRMRNQAFAAAYSSVAEQFTGRPL